MEFRQKQDQTKQDRLKYLLKQSEIFTHFILQNNKKSGATSGDGDISDQLKSALMQGTKGRDVGGKSSVSKRHQKKTAKAVDEDVEVASD